MSAQRILITGATGLVGSQLLDELSARADVEVVGTSRRGDAARQIVPWDMTLAPPDALRGTWDVIVHAAADVRWTNTAEAAHAANVVPLDGVATLAGPQTHVVQVSTAYATGRRGSVDSPDLADYRNTYEWSKAAAERLAQQRFSQLSIVRPSLIIGRSGDGRAARFQGMYVVLRGIAGSTIPCLPAAAEARCDVIPVDAVTAVLADVIDRPQAGAVRTVANGALARSARDVVPTMVDALNAWRADHGAQLCGQPRLIEPDAWDRFFLPFAREHLSSRQLLALELLRNYEPYLMLSEPIEATDQVALTDATLSVATRFWCDALPRLAAQPPRPWQAAQPRSAAEVTT